MEEGVPRGQEEGRNAELRARDAALCGNWARGGGSPREAQSRGELAMTPPKNVKSLLCFEGCDQSIPQHHRINSEDFYQVKFKFHNA